MVQKRTPDRQQTHREACVPPAGASRQGFRGRGRGAQSWGPGLRPEAAGLPPLRLGQPGARRRARSGLRLSGGQGLRGRVAAARACRSHLRLPREEAGACLGPERPAGHGEHGAQRGAGGRRRVGPSHVS